MAAKDGASVSIEQPVDMRRVLERVVFHAEAAGASEQAVLQLQALLRSPAASAMVELDAQQDVLHTMLNNDLYKINMQRMYAEFLRGISADFALNIRHCTGVSGNALAHMRDEHPQLFSALAERLCHQLQQLQPLDSRVLAALHEFCDGYEPGQELVACIAAHGVAPVTLNDVDGSPLVVASGPVCAASNAETSCMQAVQAAVIEAGAADAAAACGMVLDRTERLACSLAKMASVVERLNALPHNAAIILMAGRRSTDLLHLVFQNLYFMQHARGYSAGLPLPESNEASFAGTSSLLVAAVLRPLLEAEGMDLQQRQQLVGHLLGTHAHEMTSLIQQLLVGDDALAGAACGLQVPVCLSQLLAHLLFLVSGGTSSATALPDTFTTPYFVRLAAITRLPEECINDMATRWADAPEAGSSVFDVFRVWRLDSGDYADMAAVVMDAWEQRCQARKGAGLGALPPPKLLHSNITSLADIEQLLALPDRLRPSVLGFGGLADGFVPFQAADGSGEHVQLPVCSLVMKVVQARPAPLGQAYGALPPALRDFVPQPCAVKLGDGNLDKAQTDPRLPAEGRQAVLQRMQLMVAGGGTLSEEEHGGVLSDVLRSMYIAVVRDGLLNYSPSSAA